MYKSLIEINDFKGGMTLSHKMGRKDQFGWGVGCDFSSYPGYLTSENGFTNVLVHSAGSAFATTEITNMVHTIKDNNQYLFGENVKIYNIGTDGEMEVAGTSTDPGVFRGAIEYKNYLYGAQYHTMMRKNLVSAVNAGFSYSWLTAMASASYHKLIVSSDNLMYIANSAVSANCVGSWNGTTLDRDALTIADNWEIQDMDNFGKSYIGIAINYKTSTYSPTKSKILLWDRTVGSTWQDEIEIPEREIQAVKYVAGYYWVWAGNPNLNIYVIPEGSKIPTKMFSFISENKSNQIKVYPSSIAVKDNLIYFGVSGTTADDIMIGICGSKDGVFSFPVNPNDFRLNCIYSRSSTYGTDYKGVGILNNKIYISDENSTVRLWKQKIGATELQYGGSPESTYNSLYYDAPPGKMMKIETIGVELGEPMASACRFKMFYRINNDPTNRTAWDYHSTYGTLSKIQKMGLLEASSIQFILGFNGGNAGVQYFNRPFFKKIYATGYLINKPSPA
jgi:hypothetical protein